MHGTLSGLGRPRRNPADVRTFWELVEVHQFVTGAEDMMISDPEESSGAAESRLDVQSFAADVRCGLTCNRSEG